MLKRGYIILIAGAVLVVAGIALTAVYGSNLASLVLSESVILSDVHIDPSASVNRTLEVTNTERTVAIALHGESGESDSTQTQQQQESNISIIREEIRNPSGVVINKNQFNSSSGSEDNDGDNNDGLFTIFKPDVQGQYNLIITNLGSEPVKVGGIFGYIPIIGNNNQVNLQPLIGIIAGVILFIVGIITLIVGAIIAVLDRRKKPTLT
ncbi:MAG: hypothetical protein ICV56_06495 [Nitrososphaeraceae archaeon]|nr:hypothetical protein [Nitrososphaeraceae archaeon]